MISARSMEIRDDFKKWCSSVVEGEVVQILRPGNNHLYIVNQETYENVDRARRVMMYGTYFCGKDKITNLKRLSEIQNLKENWNNNGAAAFQDSLIYAVRKILMRVIHQPELFPTACDSIQLEWDKGTGEYLEMEVSDEKIFVFYIDAEGRERQWNINREIDKINDVIGAFYDGSI